MEIKDLDVKSRSFFLFQRLRRISRRVHGEDMLLMLAIKRRQDLGGGSGMIAQTQ